MSFLRNLFHRKGPDMMQYFEAMVEMADESERTHRGMVATYLNDIQNGILSPPPGEPPGVADQDLTRSPTLTMEVAMLIEARREVPGRIDATTGDIEFDDLAHPKLDDVLDDPAALALKMGGQLVVVPTQRMPAETGIAAIYRH